MARSAHDSWDLASSVGATATMVAAARALGSARPDPLVDDPFAAPLVRAVGIDFFTRLVDGRILHVLVLRERRGGRESQAQRQRSDAGPAVFSEFKQVLYVDRLKPESAFDQYKPFAGGAGNNDVWLKSTDGTADKVNVFQNVPHCNNIKCIMNAHHFKKIDIFTRRFTTIIKFKYIFISP